MYETEFVGNQSVERYDINNTGQELPNTYRDTIANVREVIFCFVWVFGIPGNILSAIVWLRSHVIAKNSSAVYLAVLAINDLAYLIIRLIYYILWCNIYRGWFCICCWYLKASAMILERLLVLGFSVERLIAIVRPFQVCCIFVLQSLYLAVFGECNAIHSQMFSELPSSMVLTSDINFSTIIFTVRGMLARY